MDARHLPALILIEMAKKIVETPLMKQYLEMKKKHPDAVLLFRVGDFYETFSTDAIEASAILGITLTRRANGSATHVELAGFPHHALDAYLPKLIRAGKRVAICEQLEDPKLTKKLVKRGITELVTPGVNISDNLLDTRQNNFLAGVYFGRHFTGIAFLDISTGEFLCAQGNNNFVDKLLSNIAPKELITMRGEKDRVEKSFSYKCCRFELEDWVYTSQSARERLNKHFGTHNLKGFGVDELDEAVIAAGSLLYYLDSTQHNHISHITSLSRIDEDKYVRLDRFTVRNLELVSSMAEDGKSLLDIIDFTSSPPGARMLRRRLLFPLVNAEQIRSRLNMVETLVNDDDLCQRLADTLSETGDPERIAAKTAAQRVGPRELVRLANSLDSLAHLKQIVEECDNEQLRKIGEGIDSLSQIRQRLHSTLREDAPSTTSQSGYIADGVNSELDELRSILHGNKSALNEILAREIEATGITSLKIAFNNVFGYYIEVRNTHKDKVPETWIRKQTLVNAERYITPELKDYEQRILGAEERIAIIETAEYQKLIEETCRFVPVILRNANEAAEIDCLVSSAIAAIQNNYVKPDIDDSMELSIEDGRHPVIEKMLPPGEMYVANSIKMDSDKNQILIITGPNMSGKSALLRQTALIVLLAQTGNFVPAKRAKIGIIDKIFTRVGASDNISQGESTFMVEMTEAAAILNNMSPRSLILFDELGRGTSTYDGISIAWAIVENIHENPNARPKTLFATHYHELNEMQKSFSRIANFNVAVSEINGKMVFLRRLQPGGSAHSFGIHVAKIAGIPPSIVKRAEQVLKQLESMDESRADVDKITVAKKADVNKIGTHRDGYQMSIFQLDDPLLSQIRERILGLDIDNLTPLQALTLLHELKSLLTGK
jgi:DNA mismatch repair protein MutS